MYNYCEIWGDYVWWRGVMRMMVFCVLRSFFLCRSFFHKKIGPIMFKKQGGWCLTKIETLLSDQLFITCRLEIFRFFVVFAFLHFSVHFVRVPSFEINTPFAITKNQFFLPHIPSLALIIALNCSIIFTKHHKQHKK